MAKLRKTRQASQTKLVPWIEGIYELPIKLGYLEFRLRSSLKFTEDGTSCEYFLKKNNNARALYVRFYNFLRKAAEKTLPCSSDKIDFRYFIKEHPLSKFGYEECALPVINNHSFDGGKEFCWTEKTGFFDVSGWNPEPHLSIDASFHVTYYDDRKQKLVVDPTISVFHHYDASRMSMFLTLSRFLSKSSLAGATPYERGNTDISLKDLVGKRGV